MPLDTPEGLTAAEQATHAWYQLTFRALERGLEGVELRRRLNMALPQNAIMLAEPEQKQRQRMKDLLGVVTDAIALCRGKRAL